MPETIASKNKALVLEAFDTLFNLTFRPARLTSHFSSVTDT